jgi:hypothetical protein
LARPAGKLEGDALPDVTFEMAPPRVVAFS